VKLQSRLFLLVAAALAPMVVFATVAALMLLQHERETMERDAIGRARSAMSAVDTHLRGSIASLETLAASRNLETGNIAAFHAESQRVLRTQPGWVNIGLTSGSKVQLANAVYAFGKPEPLIAADDGLDAVVRTARPGIGGVAAGNVVTSPTVRVRVPVSYGEEVRYVISAPLNLKQLAALLEAQRLPEDWVITLVDREKRVIARIPAGVPASDNFREGTEHDPEGWFLGRTMEGRPAYTAYVTSDLSGWVLAIGIPASAVEAGAQRTFTILGAGVILALALGALLALMIAGRISPP